jgi:hypothetical protein
MNKLLEAAEAVISDIHVRGYVTSEMLFELEQAVAEAKQGGAPVVEFQYKGATISGSAKDIAAVQEILASEPPDPVDALIAEIEGLPRHTGDFICADKLKAATDKYRSKK